MTSVPSDPSRPDAAPDPDTDVTGEMPLIPFDEHQSTFDSPSGLAGSGAGSADDPALDSADDPAAEPGADPVDDDEDFAPRPRQRLGVLSGLLALALAIALGFLGGEIAQKHYGTSASASGTAARAAARAGVGGFAAREGGIPGGGFGGGAGTGGTGAGGTGTGGTGTGGTGTGTGGGSSTAAVPAVIGTVFSRKGNTLVVKNLGGTKVTVHLTPATTITATVKQPVLKAGLTIAVVGTKAASGVVTARSVVIQ